ncbi:e3 ubiquitin-protein ligase trim [Anaeramoeba flamelloides]|uniref:E3 ubiquitin-protein ligase trim n=1 Tax=Anaeramoeba flamelloides TaxID=1746091 RepID=A0ABQ8XHZ4_9EUKA|nr:e3 ubiquitin-protein ligase trim [Anaeramoeba flamelloides]
MNKRKTGQIKPSLDKTAQKVTIRKKSIKCKKHDEEYKFYCKEEEKLICNECKKECVRSQCTILPIENAALDFGKRIDQILTETIEQDLESQQGLLEFSNKKTKFKSKANDSIDSIRYMSNIIKKKIDQINENNINFLTSYENNIVKKFEKIIQEKTIKKNFLRYLKKKIYYINLLKQEGYNIELIQKSKKLFKIQEEGEVVVRKRNNKKENYQEDGMVLEIGEEGGKEEEDYEEEENGCVKQMKEEKTEQKEIINENFTRINLEKLLLPREEFDPENISVYIKLKNDNKTVINQHKFMYLTVCGKNKYISGQHRIKVHLDRFKKDERYYNYIRIGVVDSKKRKSYMSNGKLIETYFFETYWKCDEQISVSSLNKYSKGEEVVKTQQTHLKEGDTFYINIDMERRQISYKINNKDISFPWKILPKKVNFFLTFAGHANITNKISIF